MEDFKFLMIYGAGVAIITFAVVFSFIGAVAVSCDVFDPTYSKACAKAKETK